MAVSPVIISQEEETQAQTIPEVLLCN